MALSTCAACKGSFFEVVEQSPRGSNYKLLFVQCATCGVVVGTHEWINAGATLQTIEKKIDDLDRQHQEQGHVLRNILAKS